MAGTAPYNPGPSPAFRGGSTRAEPNTPAGGTFGVPSGILLSQRETIPPCRGLCFITGKSSHPLEGNGRGARRVTAAPSASPQPFDQARRNLSDAFKPAFSSHVARALAGRCHALASPLSLRRQIVNPAHRLRSKANPVTRNSEISFGAFHGVGKTFLPYVKARSHDSLG